MGYGFNLVMPLIAKITINKYMPKIELTDLERFCLDAYIVNGAADNAFKYSRTRESKADAETQHRLALRWIRSEQVQAYLKERSASTFVKTEKADTAGKFRDKDSVLNALEAELPYLKGKDRLDALMKIADLQQLKKDDLKTENDLVHFYLPLPVCEGCPNKRKLISR